MTEQEKDRLLTKKVKSILHRDDFEFVDSIDIETFLYQGKIATNQKVVIAKRLETGFCDFEDVLINKSQYNEILELMQELSKYL